MTTSPAHTWRRRSTVLVAAVVTLCLGLTGLTMQSASAADTGSITGAVFTKATPAAAQLPASDVTIYLYYSATETGYYDSVDTNPATPGTDGFRFDGSAYSLTGLKAGFYKINVAGVADVAGVRFQREYYNDAQYLSSATAIQVGSVAVTGRNVVLEPAGQITGQVKDAAGRPIPGANVSFLSTANGESDGVTADANGFYTSAGVFGKGLVRGQYRVSARHYSFANPDSSSHEEEYWQNAKTFTGATAVTVTPGQTSGNINFSLDVAPRMRLTVKDPAGNPMPNTPVGIHHFYNGAWVPYAAGPNDTDARGVHHRTLRIGDRYKFFITPPQGMNAVREWYDNVYTEAAAKEIKATAHGQVIDFEIKLGPAPAVTGSTPTVTGTPQVAKTLTATPGTWGPAGVKLTYQWLAGGTAITGATGSSYQSTSADVAKTISVKVTGTLANHTTTAKTSTPTAAVTAAPVPVVITGAVPTISGTPRSGATLTAAPNTWTPSSTKLTYRWFASGVLVPGVTSRWFTPSNAQAGKTITVAVTGTVDGSAPVTRSSSATKAVVGVLSVSKVSISGSTKVGRTLRATTKDWAPKPITLAYRWYRNGTTISGQNKVTYKLRKADKGKRITVRVTQSKVGYASASKLSSKTAKIRK